MKDLTAVRAIGEGDLGQVLLVKSKIDNHEYALKIMNKKQIRK